MNQYCRYCNNLVTGNGTYCEAKEKEISDRAASRINHCKKFEFNEIDAYDIKRKYKPRENKNDKPKTFDTVSLFDAQSHQCYLNPEDDCNFRNKRDVAVMILGVRCKEDACCRRCRNKYCGARCNYAPVKEIK